MSRKGQRPRTPEHFPKMKYRARKRHSRREFEAALMLAYRTWPQFRTVFVDAMEKAIDQLTHVLHVPEARDELVEAALRSPWFETLADAEARGAHGSAEVGFAQCGCDDCERRDDELLRSYPIEQITASKETDRGE